MTTQRERDLQASLGVMIYDRDHWKKTARFWRTLWLIALVGMWVAILF